MSGDMIKTLEGHAARCRRNVLRMVEAGGAGHMGGAMSCIDVVTALYFSVMNIDPANPKMSGRDRFILSAGHKCMAQYAVLAERGFFDKKVLDTYGSLHTKIPGHPDMHKLPGVEANTGALGHGLSIGLGMALGLKLDQSPARVFVVMGDGELAEGSNWEAVAAAAHHKADNLTVIVDYNGLQIGGKTADIMSFEPVRARFEAFGWAGADIDGNSMPDVVDALGRLPFEKGKPSVIVAHTVKAKGLSFAENKAAYHYWKPGADELEQAIRELDAQIEEAGA
ncbi:MAG: transketolase [Oscillospiraceae bacterium]|jgi:transketolase|nr:transketolase [Oscillospiraceae bacterium]